jgi:hypothetical protein
MWFSVLVEPDEPLDDLLAHLERLTGLGRRQLGRLVEEVAAYFSESLEEFVTRRHAELQRDEIRNQDIFDRIGREVKARRFASAPLSTRQIRRIVYG